MAVVSPRRRRGDPSPGDAAGAPIQFRLESREERVTTAEGRILTGRGYLMCDAQTGAPLGEDDFFFRIGGGIVCDLAEAQDHLSELQAPAFRPGRTLALHRAPESSGDRPAVIEVRSSDRSTTVGALPPDVADAVAFYGDESYGAAFCLWEWRTESGERFALRLLLAPGWTVEALPDFGDVGP